MTKAIKKLGSKGTYFNLIKTTYKNPMTNIIVDRERKAASISCKTRKETRVNETGYLLSQVSSKHWKS